MDCHHPLHPRRLGRLGPVVAAALFTLGATGSARADCAVTYTVSNQWSSGFGAEVTVRNTGAAAMSGWTLGWSFAAGQTVTQLWNGAVAQSSAQVTVTNAAHNGGIPANGGSVSFGFNGTWSASNPVPTSFTLNGVVCGGGQTATTLTLAASGTGTTSPAAGSHRYAPGTAVSVTAIPASGSTFLGWSGAATGTANPVTVTMDGDKTLTASFSTSTSTGIRWTGRVIANDPSAVKLGWQGSGLIARVRGTSIAARLRSDGDTIVYQPVIDGTLGARFAVPAGPERTVTLATGLVNADHVVELYRETEGWAVSTFLGFASGTVTGAPASSGRLIEIIGDSISAGYGNLGSEPHPNWVANPACHYTPDNSSWARTYGAVAGRALGAEVSTIAHSGWGLFSDRNGDRNGALPAVYEDALSNGDPTEWTFGPKPQVVVINLGTNDTASPSGFQAASYTAAGVAFAQTIRARYPDAWIFFTIGPMLNQSQLDAVNAAQAAIVTARRNAGDTRIASFDLGIQNLGSNGEIPSGCDWHPSLTEHQRMAAALQAQIRARLGW